jgi:hypothetical protein
MDSPITNTLANVAGRGVGVLAALDSIKSGGLGSYLIQREKAIADPDIRANLIGSPFAAGMLQVSGDTARPPVATPADFVGPPTPAAAVAGPSDIAYLAPSAPDRRWTPNLPPLSTAEQVKQATEQGTLSGLRGTDIVARIQAKLGAKIPLTNEELAQAVGGARAIQASAGPGSTVGLTVPGMPIQVGSPYNLSSMGPEEYPTPDAAAAAASQRPGYRVVPSGRGTWLLAPPPTREQILPQTPPPPTMTPSLQTAPGARTSALPAPRPGFVHPLDVRFDAAADQNGLPRGLLNAMAERESSFDPTIQGPVLPQGDRAQGLMQFRPATAQRYGIDPTNPDQAIPGAARYLSDLVQSNGGDLGAALQQYGGGPSYPVASILARAQVYGAANRPAVATAAAPAPPEQLASVGFPSAAPTDEWQRNLQQRVQAGWITPEQAQAAGATAPAAPAAPAPVVTPPVQVAPPPPPPPRRPAPVAVASAAPTFDPNAVVPHVMVPAQTAAPEVGFPPPAPSSPAPISRVPVLTAPTAAPAAPAAAPAPQLGTMPAPAAVLPGIPVDPTTKLPLQGRTVESQSGSDTYSAPNLGDVPTTLKLRWAGITNPILSDPAGIANYFAQERAIKQRNEMDSADIARLKRGLTEGEDTGLRQLLATKQTLNDFLTRYPDANTRAQFVGAQNALPQTAEIFLQLPWAKDAADFRTAIAPIAPDTFTSDEKARTLLTQDMALLRPVAPSVRDSPDLFESKLQSFSDRLDDQLALRAATSHMAAGDINADVMNGWLDQLQQARLARRMAAFAPAAAPPPAAPPSPPAAPPGAAPDPSAWAPDWIR